MGWPWTLDLLTRASRVFNPFPSVMILYASDVEGLSGTNIFGFVPKNDLDFFPNIHEDILLQHIFVLASIVN